MSVVVLDFNFKSIRLTVLSVFEYLENLKENPEHLTCIFPSLNSNYFYQPIDKNFFEYSFVALERDKNYFAPYNYTKLIGLDWIYFYNLTDISVLENFCSIANIKLKWTTKDKIPESIKNVIIKEFKGYVDNENI